jgi:lysophospholipase L1-like esterase
MNHNSLPTVIFICVGITTISACGGGGTHGGAGNESPIAVDDNAQTVSETPVTIDVIANDKDPDGSLQPNTVAILSAPDHGSAISNGDGTVTYTPDTGFTGPTDTFTYTVNDDEGATSNTATVTVSIQNLAPQANNDCHNTPQEDPFSGVLPGNDPDNSPGGLTFSLLENGADADLGPIFTLKGQIQIDDTTTGAFTYTPNALSRRGADTFEYRVEDTEGGSDTGVVTMIINPKIMPLGDSITQGIIQGINGNLLPPLSERGGYRKPLFDRLLNAGYGFDFVGRQSIGVGISPFDPDNEGYAGAKDEQIANGGATDPETEVTFPGIFQALNDATHQADIILLHIGTNDINVNPGDTSPNDVRAILTEINRWEGSANGNPVAVVLARIIDQCNGTQCDPEPAIIAFNDNVVNMAQGLGAGSGPDELVIVDQRSALLKAGNPDPNLYGSVLHPNAEGYDRMAEVWFEALTNANGGPSIFEKCPP